MADIRELETKPIGKLLWTFALPAVITQVVASIYNIVDRVFLGQYVGEMAIAGLAITLPLMNIIHAFGAMVGVGASARMSIVLGRKDIRWAEKILGNSILLTFFFGFLFVTGGYLFMDQILELFGASHDTIGFAREYMQIVLPGMFFTTLSFNLTGLIRASGYPTKSMWIMAGGAVLNMILDALFICLMGWGIAGAAWATTISMVTMAVVSIAHFLQPSSFIRFKRHAWAPKLYIFRNVLLIGLSPFLMNFAASFVVALLNRQLIHYGNIAVALSGGDLAVGAYGVVNTYCSFLVMLILGICQGMQPIAGYNYGARLYGRLHEVLTRTITMATCVMTFGFLLGMFVPQLCARAFTTDPELIMRVAHDMRIQLLAFPIIGFQIVTTNFFQCIGMPGKSIFLSLSRQLIFLLPPLLILPRLIGSDGIWWSMPISDTLATFTTAYLFFRQMKKFKRMEAAQ